MLTLDDLRQAIAALSTKQRSHLFRWLRQTGGESELGVRESAPDYAEPYATHLLTVEEYLALDESADIRYEYVAGQVFAMSGGTVAHGTIIVNVLTAIHAHLKGGPCRTFADGMKLHLKAGRDTVFYYPDVAVFCGKFDPRTKSLQNPTLIVEVLSPSTERIDRTEKAANYWQIASLEEYVLISQSRAEVTIQQRQVGARAKVVTLREGMVNFQSIGLPLHIDRIYEGAL